jgi:hypothetical protein
LNKVSTIPVQKADGVDTVEGILLGAAAWLATSIGVAIGWSRFHRRTRVPPPPMQRFMPASPILAKQSTNLNQLMVWQDIAAIPDNDRDKEVQERKDLGKPITRL